MTMSTMRPTILGFSVAWGSPRAATAGGQCSGSGSSGIRLSAGVAGSPGWRRMSGVQVGPSSEAMGRS